MPQKLDWRVQRFQAIKKLNRMVVDHINKHGIQPRMKDVVRKALLQTLSEQEQRLIARKVENRRRA